MKVWVKYLAGAALGIVLGIFFAESGIFASGAKFAVEIGKYSFLPLIFFSVAFSVSRLAAAHLVAKTVVKLILFTASSSLILTFIGGASALLLFNGRIPVTSAESAAIPLSAGDANFFLPLLALAVIMGICMNPSNLRARPAAQTFDSVARIFFDINSIVVDFMWIGIAFMSASFTASIVKGVQLATYKYLLIAAVAASSFAIFILIPVAVRLFGTDKKPFKLIYALFASAIAAFFSGNVYFGASTLTKSLFENVGAKRKTGAPSVAFLMAFGRGGTAMVSAIAAVVVIKSYSGMEISPLDFVMLMLFTFATSFTLGSVPGIGTAASLSAICTWYAHGMEEGYGLIAPVIPILISLGALVDIVVMGAICAVIARQMRLCKDVDAAKFT